MDQVGLFKQDSVLIIGQSTCLGSSNLLTIECVLLSELNFDETTYTWTKKWSSCHS